MHYGFVLPGGTATQQLELAELADMSGWDGVFVWEVASQVVTLDQLSQGGAILAVGFWAGRLRFDGRHFQADLSARDDLAEVAAPVQARIPMWVVAAWPSPKSMRRAIRCDGLIPHVMDGTSTRETTPDAVRAIRAWLDEHDAPPGFDIVAEGETPADDPVETRRIIASWAEAGCTWWLESRWALPHHSPDRLREVGERLAAGPPGRGAESAHRKAKSR